MTGLLINGDRLRTDFEALAQIGATGDGGVHRPAFCEAHLTAQRWFLERAMQAGLAVHVDGAGNHSAVLHQGNAEKTLLLGSHLDSVPQGGRFDGALGVLAALEVLRVVKDSGTSLPVHLEAIDFVDEEGTLVGALGSEALVGMLTPERLQAPRGGRAALEAGLASAGLSEAWLFGAKRSPQSLAGYLELHIEQGPRLEAMGASIGIVTGIVGSRSFHLSFSGQANHAGTTPMETRADAGLGASAFVLAAHETVHTQFPSCVATVGQMCFEPGVFNIIPGRAQLSLEFRSTDESVLDAMEATLLAQAHTLAGHFGLHVETALVTRWKPIAMHAGIQAAIAQAAERLGLRHVFLPSGAGHDAQSLARITPTGMVFVPSVGGYSHGPREFTAWEDCVNGANVLLGAALQLARKVG